MGLRVIMDDDYLYQELESGLLVYTGHKKYELDRKSDGVIVVSFGLAYGRLLAYREERYHCQTCGHQHLDPGLFFMGEGSPSSDKQRFDGI
jgi:hypothetical protein